MCTISSTQMIDMLKSSNDPAVITDAIWKRFFASFSRRLPDDLLLLARGFTYCVTIVGATKFSTGNQRASQQ